MYRPAFMGLTAAVSAAALGDRDGVLGRLVQTDEWKQELAGRDRGRALRDGNGEIARDRAP